MLPARPVSLQDLGNCRPPNLVKPCTAQQHALFLNDSRRGARALANAEQTNIFREAQKSNHTHNKTPILLPSYSDYLPHHTPAQLPLVTEAHVDLKFLPLLLGAWGYQMLIWTQVGLRIKLKNRLNIWNEISFLVNISIFPFGKINHGMSFTAW